METVSSTNVFHAPVSYTHLYKRSLKASFYMAIQDDCIRKNPFNFKLSDVLEDDTEAKVILTPEQEEKLLAFMETDNVYSKYRDEVILLLETEMCIRDRDIG